MMPARFGFMCGMHSSRTSLPEEEKEGCREGGSEEGRERGRGPSEGAWACMCSAAT